MITVLVPPPLTPGGEKRLDGAPYRHLFRARRLATGERLRLVDGEGTAHWGLVEQVTARQAVLRIAEPAPSGEPAARVELLVAPPRAPRAAWLVEKATELGVAAVRFVATGRAPRRYGSATLSRLRRIAAAAVEQCHRARTPAVTGVHPWAELESLLAPLPARWLLDTGAAAPPPRLAPGATAVLVGPEGGWTGAERRRLAALDCRPAGLGERTLRVETAALAAATLLLSAGDPFR